MTSKHDDCNCEQSQNLQQTIDMVYFLLTNGRVKSGRDSAISVLEPKVKQFKKDLVA